VLDITAYTGPLLAGWLEKGHRIAAIVAPEFLNKRKGFSVGNFRRRLRRKLLLRRYLGNTPLKLIEFGRPYDWDELDRQLPAADVLICFAFPAIIPQRVLNGFAKGGVNLHPALLPHYRGPQPFHRLVVDGQHAIHGGVTLHRMNEAFDEGDVLAQVPFSEADWRSTPVLVASVAAAMRLLVNEAVPAYCTGVLTGVPQPAGVFVWARLDSTHLLIPPASSIEHVARLWRVLGIVPGIYLRVDGQTIRLGFRIRRLGPATGKAPVRRCGTVAFDLADGRVLHFTYSRLLKRLVNLQRLFARAPIGKTRPEIRFFG